jgi:hypothetical protein
MKFPLKRKVKIVEKPIGSDTKRLAREKAYEERITKVQKRRSYAADR